MFGATVELIILKILPLKSAIIDEFGDTVLVYSSNRFLHNEQFEKLELLCLINIRKKPWVKKPK